MRSPLIRGPVVYAVRGATGGEVASTFAQLVADLLKKQVIASPAQCALLAYSIGDGVIRPYRNAFSLQGINIARPTLSRDQPVYQLAVGALLFILDPLDKLRPNTKRDPDFGQFLELCRMLSSEFWQARVYLTEGILTTFTEFSCLAGRDDAFCNASEWTVQVEQGKYNPAYTMSAFIKKQPKTFRVTKGFAHIKSTWIECSEREISRMITQYNQLEGHTTILTLKALLPNTKVAGPHTSTGLPLH